MSAVPPSPASTTTCVSRLPCASSARRTPVAAAALDSSVGW